MRKAGLAHSITGHRQFSRIHGSSRAEIFSNMTNNLSNRGADYASRLLMALAAADEVYIVAAILAPRALVLNQPPSLV